MLVNSLVYNLSMFDKEYVLKLYRKYGVKASKLYGQNFLINENIINIIIKSAEIKGQNVVEIGPGLGALTKKLLVDAKTLVAYEIDPDMQKVLSSEIKNDNFFLIGGDFLTQNLNWKNKKVLVANIPYNITSEILFKLFKNTNKFSHAIIMMQKEVGDRLLAKVKSKSYGKLSVTSKYFANITKITDINADAFLPQPKVNSIVVRFNFLNSSYDYQLMDFVKLCFRQQRKKLTNNLKGFYNIEKLKAVLEKMHINESIRPQELSLSQLLEIYNSL